MFVRPEKLNVRDLLFPTRLSSDLRNVRGGRSRDASRYGYSPKNFLPVIRMPQLLGGLNAPANSLSGASPRNRYIGLTRELPAVSSMASSPPSSCSHLAVCRDSSIGLPPRTPSAIASLAVTAIVFAPCVSTASRPARTRPRATLARVSTETPPPSSTQDGR